jgi:iron complex outermembrane receptor protein
MESRKSRKPGDVSDGKITIFPRGKKEKRQMKKCSKKVKIFVLLMLFVLFTPGAVFGETKAPGPEKTVTLEEVVVTATRDREEVRQVPANVSVITARQIEQSGAATVVEVLEKLESIQFRSYSGNASQALIDMRGFGGDNPFGKTLVMLDGRRLNRPDMSSINWMQIPVNTIERIEVVRGASSVLYGDAAIGGVVNIITKKGEGPPKFNASVMAGSDGLHNERVGVSGAENKWNYALTGENKFSFGYRERSKFLSQGGGFDVGYNASDWFGLSLGASFNKTDYQMPGALTKAQMEQNRRQYQPATPANFASAAPDDDGSDKYTNVNLGIRSNFGSWGQMDVNFLYGRKDLQTNMPSWAFTPFSDTGMDTYGITPKYILAKEILGFRNKLIVGVDYYREPYKKEFFSSRERTTKTAWADLTRESAGYYIRDEFSLLKNLILSAGYRSEQASIKGSHVDIVTPANNFTGQEKTYHAEAYEAGLTWLVGKKSKIFAKYATVYRIPFLDEVASFNGFGGASFITSLEREKGASMEAGTEFHPMENLKIGATLFRIDMKDEIQYVYTTPWTGFNQNVGKSRHDGAEISLSWLWDKQARLYGNFTYHLATVEEGPYNKKEMTLAPNRMANVGVEIFLPWNLTIRPDVRHVGEAYLSQDFDNNAEKLRAYTLCNLYLFYRPSIGKIRITAFFGVENLTNVKYESFGSDNASWGGVNTYYPMPGIQYKGGLSFEF